MSKITIPIQADSIGQLLDPYNRDNAKDAASRDKIVCKNAIKQKLYEVLVLNKTINDTSLDTLPDYDDLKKKKQQRSILIEEIWELYCEAKGIEFFKPREQKKVINMTSEELEAVLKAVNANRPQVIQTMNFNAPIGQQIAHVDKIEAHFDKDMKMEIACAEEISALPNNVNSTFIDESRETELSSTNQIIVTEIDGRPISLYLLHKYICETIGPEIKYGYSWVPLWIWMKKHNLIKPGCVDRKDFESQWGQSEWAINGNTCKPAATDHYYLINSYQFEDWKKAIENDPKISQTAINHMTKLYQFLDGPFDKTKIMK